MNDRYLVFAGDVFQASYNFALTKSAAFKYADWTARLTKGRLYEQINNGDYKLLSNYEPKRDSDGN